MRFERDLHDGAQQRLVALRIELELAELVRQDRGGAARLHELERELDEALTTCDRSPMASIRRCSRTAGWSTRCARLRGGPSSRSR